MSSPAISSARVSAWTSPPTARRPSNSPPVPVLRRGERSPDEVQDQVIVAGAIEIDTGRREARCDGRAIPLRSKEFDLLELLASSPGRTFRRSELLELVWDSGWEGEPSTVTVHVPRLREKIEEDPSEPRHILT